MRTPRREATRNVGLLLAMLASLILARWTLAGGFSTPLIPAKPAPSQVKGTASSGAVQELRGRRLYLGGHQPLMADAGGGPLRPLPIGMAGPTSVLRQGRYLVVRVAEPLQEGPVLALVTDRPGTAMPLGSEMDVLPSPHSDRVWLLDRRARSPQRTFTLQEVELATGRRLATVALPPDAEPWSEDGWLFFFSGGPPPDMVAAWRPGWRTANPLDLRFDGATATIPGGLAT